jgi:hypothetical protein
MCHDVAIINKDMYYKEVMEKDQEISRLKEHSQNLLDQIKKKNYTKKCVQKLEQENQDLGKKLLEKK